MGAGTGPQGRGTATDRVRGTARRLSEGMFNLIRRGRTTAVLSLAAVALGTAAVGGLVLNLLHLSRDGRQLDFPQALWESMIRTLDPGQLDVVSGADRPGRWGFAVVALVLTLLGILLVASLISIITNSVGAWVERSARGRSRAPRVPAGREYVVMLGWTDLSRRILRELAASAPSAREVPQVLVLAPVEIGRMEQEVDELRRHEDAKRDRNDPANPGATVPRHWPHFRTGDPTDAHDLRDLAAIGEATSVVVLAPHLTGDGDAAAGAKGSRSGAEVVKTVFAVGTALTDPHHTGPGGTSAAGAAAGGPPRPLPVVVEVPEGGADDRLADWLRATEGADHADVLRILPVDTPKIQSRLAAQAVRSSGLSDVYLDLLNFDGHEIYVTGPVPEDGTPTFGDAVASYAGGVALGVIDAEGSADLWPDWSAPVAGRGLVVLREHDERVPRVGADHEGAPTGSRPAAPHLGDSEHGVLILGWNDRASEFLRDLRRYSATDVRVTVVVDAADREQATTDLDRAGCDGVRLGVARDSLVEWARTDMEPSGLEFRDSSTQLDDELNDIGHVVLLADTAVPASVSDAYVLLLQRSLHPPQVNGNPATVVAQLRERPSRALASRHHGHDLIVGHGLTALLLAQFTHDPARAPALEELLWGSTVELDLVAPQHLDVDNIPTPFSEVRAACWKSGLIPLGFRDRPHDAPAARPRLVLAPPDDADIGPEDEVVVLRRLPGMAT